MTPQSSRSGARPGPSDIEALRARGVYGRGSSDRPSGADRDDGDDYQRLQRENRELRSLLDEMKPILEEAQNQEQNFSEQQGQIEENLQLRDTRIQELETQLAEIEEQINTGELVPRPKTQSELEDWVNELEQESTKINQDRRDLEDDRRQLREDEESLKQQMREIEVQMARERALLARQETELKRLSAEIQRELELFQNGDASLRERLSQFSRRHQEVMTHGTPRRAGNSGTAMQAEPAPQQAPSAPTPSPRDSGLLRRFFGGSSE